jgi:hypothetical protein
MTAAAALQVLRDAPLQAKMSDWMCEGRQLKQVVCS